MSSQEQTIQAIQNYLESDMPNAALLINGEWGAGKTYFWKNSIVPMLEKKSRHHVYVSLYGVSSHAEIEQQVLYGIFPFLDSKIARLGKFIGEMNGYRVPPIKYVPKLHRAVFCFDDLERSSLTVSDVLGYINRFIEQYETHVLILANEVQITDDRYSAVKEKVIGKTFAMKPDMDLAMSNIWSTLKNKSRLLDNHRQSIEKAIKSCDPVNLRSAIQAVDNCNLVLHRLEKLPSLKEGVVDSVMEMTSAITMESKLNGQLISHLRGLFANPQALMFAAYSKREDENENSKLEFLEKFAARYFEGGLEKIPSLQAILDFIESGWIDIDLLHAQALALTPNEKPEEADPKHTFLRNIWSLGDQKVIEVAQSYIRDVNAGLITQAQLLARAFSTLVFIAKHQVIEQTPAQLLEQFLKAIEQLSLEDRFSEHDIGQWDAQNVFYGPLEAEVVNLVAALNAARDKFMERRHQERLRSLFNEFDRDYEKFLQRMMGKLDEDFFDYAHRPVFANFDSEAFADVILKKNTLDIQHFSQLLNQRYYRVVNIADFLKEESAVLLKLASRLKERLPSVAASMKRVVIGRVIEQLEQASKKLNPQLAPEEKLPTEST
jgi:DNA polymerase III delta prime subunit